MKPGARQTIQTNQKRSVRRPRSSRKQTHPGVGATNRRSPGMALDGQAATSSATPGDRLDARDAKTSAAPATSRTAERMREATKAEGPKTPARGFTLEKDARSVTIRVPMTFRKHGGRKLIVAPSGLQHSPVPPRPGGALIRAVARAFRWRKALESGVHETIEELAATEDINASYVSRILRLSLLAPRLVEAIVEGRQPKTVQLNALLKPGSYSSYIWELQR